MKEYEKIKKECRQDEKGITMITLVLTVTILLIILGVTMYTGTSQLDLNQNKVLEMELDIMFNATLQTYTTNSLTGKSYPGRSATDEEIEELELILGIDILDTEKDEYYVIEPGDDAKNMGIENSSDTYLINYKKGITYNISKKQTSEGVLLYKSNI